MAKKPTETSKRELYEKTIQAALTAAAAARPFLSQVRGVSESGSLAHELLLGGREATQEWVEGVLSTLNHQQLMAFKWAVMDERRSMLPFKDAENGLSLIKEIHNLAEQGLLHEKRRVRLIKEENNQRRGVAPDDYVAIAVEVLNDQAERNNKKTAFNKRVVDKGFPPRGETQRNEYFRMAQAQKDAGR